MALPTLEPSDADPSQLVLPWADAPYRATWDEVADRFGTNALRQSLLAATRSRLFELEDQAIPIYAVWVNGSFVTSKERPGDLDALVLIDGDRIAHARVKAGLSAATMLIRVQSLQRYERNASAADHKTDFQYVTYYDGDGQWSRVTQSELDHWFTVWSRLEIDQHDGHVRGKLTEDAKGFVEVRW